MRTCTTLGRIAAAASRRCLVLDDGRTVSAEVVGSDAANDIEVVRVRDSGALPPAAIGSPRTSRSVRACWPSARRWACRGPSPGVS
ncbi:hypothetical protein BN11_50031 [Nostocoides australiense Ben110]|uniref:Uncharacterized protein n=1 Tax=Nostocoides australiense Ben110 TaxID=1193182 RepID=W6K1W2_9MICO|nr:hypothetical protein BN11_50031 [Tetrasphaera australiensis Ben110]